MSRFSLFLLFLPLLLSPIRPAEAGPPLVTMTYAEVLAKRDAARTETEWMYWMKLLPENNRVEVTFDPTPDAEPKPVFSRRKIMYEDEPIMD